MSDYPMLISNKLHSFRNFRVQMGDASDHILLKDIISIGKTSADGHQTEQRQAGKEIGKGTIISIKGMVRDVQATPADRVEIYSTAQQRVVGVTDKSGRYTIEVPEDDILVFRKSGYLNEEVNVAGKSSILITIRNGTDL